MAESFLGRHEKPKILIVDDIELNRAMLCTMFQPNYTIFEAENGKKALEILEQHQQSISVVLLDIIMPVLDGFGVLSEMARRDWIGRIPVIMITAETTDDVMQKGYEMGVADIISKPFNPNIVRQRIHNIIEQYTYKQHLETLVLKQTEELRAQSRKLRENSIQIIDTLSTIIEFKNTESVQHIYNIRIITKLLLTELSKQHNEYGLTQDLVEIISEASAMHDIGKIAIPDNILNKPGKLTPEEFEIMKTHSIRGCEILERLSSVRHLDYYDYCYEICHHHHERWDGRGYPDGLVGDETPIWAQAVSLADVYDALISKRVYKDAYASDKAVEMILNGECGAFNPVLIDCFLKIMPTLADYASHIRNGDLPQENYHSSAIEDTTTDVNQLLNYERQKNSLIRSLTDGLLFEYDYRNDVMACSPSLCEYTGLAMNIQSFKDYIKNLHIISSEELENIYVQVRSITPADPVREVEINLTLADQKEEKFLLCLYPVWGTGFHPKCEFLIGKLIKI